MFKKLLFAPFLALLLLAPVAVGDGEHTVITVHDGPMKDKSWKLPADFFRGARGDEEKPNTDGSYSDEQVIQVLKDCGVIIPKGATASYKGGKLTAHTTQLSLDMIQETVDAYWSDQPDIYQATWKIPRETMKWAASDLKPEMKQREREGFDFIKISGAKITAVGPEHSINDLGNYLEASYEAELSKKKHLGKRGQVKTKGKRGKKN